MKSIFDAEFKKTLESCLTEAGMSKEQAHSIYKGVYKKELKEEALNRLKFITKCLEEDKYNEIEKNLAYSGAGDGYGQDNYYIYFGDVTDCNDIMDVIETLKEQ